MLFRLAAARGWELVREMDVAITREQASDWLNGIALHVAAPQLTQAEHDFLMQGAMPEDGELLALLDVMLAGAEPRPAP